MIFRTVMAAIAVLLVIGYGAQIHNANHPTVTTTSQTGH